MGIITETFAAQLAELKQRSEETDKQMLEGLARTKAMVNKMAEDKPVSDEEMIAEAILLLQEHGYTVTRSSHRPPETSVAGKGQFLPSGIARSAGTTN